jgi:CheY-like chemotaxis protein
MDGLEATRCIRAWEGHKQRELVPVIAVTAMVLPQVGACMLVHLGLVVHMHIARDNLELLTGVVAAQRRVYSL